MYAQDTGPSARTIQLGVIPEEFLEVLRAHGAKQAAVFGSVAKGEAGPGSDIDLLVTFDHDVTLFEQLRLADRLGQVAGRKVDLMTELHPAFEPFITPTLVPLPL